jgi:hypothetical protein
MRRRSPGALHDGYPFACLGDAPFGYVNVFASHVNVGFFHGAALPDPACLLQDPTLAALSFNHYREFSPGPELPPIQAVPVFGPYAV